MVRPFHILQSTAAAIGLVCTLAASPALGQLPITTLAVDFRTATNASGVPAAITPGTTATFSVTVSNLGSSRAYGVTLTGTFAPVVDPPRTTISAASSACQINTDRLSFTCNIGALADDPAGQPTDGGYLAASSATITFTVRLALPPKPYGTNCTFSGTSLGTATVSASANNAPTVMATTGATVTRPFADLAVTLTGPATAREGDTVTFQGTATNFGPCDATRVRLTNDNAGAGLIFQSNSGACTSGFPCTLGDPWPAGSTVSVTSTYKIDSLTSQFQSIISNGNPNELDIASTARPNPDGGAALAAATNDPDLSNNAAQTQTVVSKDAGCNSIGSGPTLGVCAIALLLILRLKYRHRARG